MPDSSSSQARAGILSISTWNKGVKKGDGEQTEKQSLGLGVQMLRTSRLKVSAHISQNSTARVQMNMVHHTRKQGLGTEPPASANIIMKSLEACLLVTGQGGMESAGTAIIVAVSGWI